MEKVDIWFVLNNGIVSTCVRVMKISELEETLVMN